ncbi:transposase [Streptomyces umbrinus]|uniref:Transposase n=1 Tax=Streptomyces umbrinus TaxID=67370 RepID=A0ABU0TAS2_9ACTN|nr:transposase [Streptomyces umbrinus]
MRVNCVPWRQCWTPGPAVCGWSDQCWTLARIAEIVRHRFGVECALAGLDLLLHRIGWSVQIPSR